MSAARFCLVLAATLLTCATNQSKAATVRTGHASTQSTETPVRRFDLNSDQLPSGFVGDDITAVFESLSPAKKGEFETTEQYNARVGKTQSQPQTAYAFAAENRVLWEYNADKQEFSGRLLNIDICIHDGFRPDCGNRAFIAKRIELSRSEHPGSNAYGATVTVLKVDEDVYGVIWPGREPTTRTTVTAPVSLEEAPTAKAQLQLLAIVMGQQGNQPATMTGISVLTATISSPVEGTDHYFYVRLPLKEFWVVNKSTGKVYSTTKVH